MSSFTLLFVTLLLLVSPLSCYEEEPITDLGFNPRSSGGNVPPSFYKVASLSTQPRQMGPIYSVDMDGDGDLDLITQTVYEIEIMPIWWRNEGGYNFVREDTLLTTLSGTGSYILNDLQVGDYDSDGDIDILFTPNGNDVVFYEQDNGTYISHTVTGPSVGVCDQYSYVTQLIQTDFNNDGKLDFIFICSNALNGSIWAIRNYGGGNFTYVELPLSNYIGSKINYASTNLVVDGANRKNGLFIVNNDGDTGYFSYSDLGEYHYTDIGHTGFPNYISATDLNADNKLEVVTGGRYCFKVNIFYKDQISWLQQNTTELNALCSRCYCKTSLATGDIDMDRANEIIGLIDGKLFVYFSNSNGGYVAKDIITSADATHFNALKVYGTADVMIGFYASVDILTTCGVGFLVNDSQCIVDPDYPYFRTTTTTTGEEDTSTTTGRADSLTATTTSGRADSAAVATATTSSGRADTAAATATTTSSGRVDSAVAATTTTSSGRVESAAATTTTSSGRADSAAAATTTTSSGRVDSAAATTTTSSGRAESATTITSSGRAESAAATTTTSSGRADSDSTTTTTSGRADSAAATTSSGRAESAATATSSGRADSATTTTSSGRESISTSGRESTTSTIRDSISTSSGRDSTTSTGRDSAVSTTTGRTIGASTTGQVCDYFDICGVCRGDNSTCCNCVHGTCVLRDRYVYCLCDSPWTGPNCSTTEPPTALYAQFNTEGTGIYVTFSQATNSAGMKLGNDSCSVIFNATSIKLLGSSKCSWTNSSLLYIALAGDATVKAFDQLHLAANTIYAQNASVAAYGSVTVIAFATRLDITLEAPQSVGSCDAFSVIARATGSGGREFTAVNWRLQETQDAPNVELYNLLLANVTALTLNVPASVLTPGYNYTLTLSATNFLGQIGRSVIILSRSLYAIPTIVTSAPPQMSVKRATSFYIEASVAASSCAPNASMTWSWSAVALSNAAKAVSIDSTRNTKKLYIPANSLASGEAYSFTVVGTYRGTSLSNSATVLIIVLASDLVASITGAAERTVSVGRQITLSAAKSYDPDNSANLAFRWTCTTQNNPCSGVRIQEGAEVVLAAGKLQAGSTYIFSVAVSSTSPNDNRTASAQTTLITLAANIPLVTFSSVPDALVSAGQRVIIVGNAASDSSAGPVTYSWVAINSDFSLNDTSRIITPLNRPTLGIAANTLTIGRAYQFRLLATNQEGTGSADVSFTVAAPPGGGYLTVSPASGLALNTSFTLSAPNWETYAGLNLYYQFSYVLDGVENFLGSKSLASTLSTKLPASSASPTVSIVVRVSTDVGLSTATFNISISLPQVSKEEAAAFVSSQVSSLLSDMTQYGDTDTALNTIVMLSTLAPSISGDGISAVNQELLSSFFVVQSLQNSTSTTTTTTLEQQTTAVAALTQNFQTLTPDLQAKTLQFLVSAASGSTSSSKAADGIISGLSNLFAATGSSASKRSTNSTSTFVIGKSDSESIRSAVSQVASWKAADLVCGEDPVYVASNSLQVAVAKVYPQDLNKTHTIGNSTGGIAFPDGLLQVDGCFSANMFKQPTSLYAWAPNFTSPVSEVYTYSLNVDGAEFPVHNLSSPITIRIPVTKSSNASENTTASCQFYSVALGRWDTDGCKMDANLSTDSLVVCKCTHLTDFAVQLVKAASPLNDVGGTIGDTKNIFKNARKNYQPIVIVAVLFFAYVCAMIYSRRVDLKQEKTGDDHAYDKKKELETKNPCLKMLRKLRRRLTTNHRYVSVYFRKANDPYSRTRRVTIIFCVVLSSLAANAIFYEKRHLHKSHIDVAERILTAFWSALIVVPINLFLTICMRKARPYSPYALNATPSMIAWPDPEKLDVNSFNADGIQLHSMPPPSPTSAMRTSPSTVSRVGVSSDPDSPAPSPTTNRRPLLIGKEQQPPTPRQPSPKQSDKKPLSFPVRTWRKTKALTMRTWPWWMAIVAYVLCACVSGLSMFLILLYGIRFPGSVLNGWMASSFFSIGQDIFINQPLTTVVSAFAGTAFGGLVAFLTGK